jgi:flavin-dependent dehydrogenase
VAEICVIGAGPAGSSFAARMAQLGHEVSLIERAPFPRSRLGESLSPGLLPLLDITGARAAVEASNVRRVASVQVKWGGAPEIRPGGRDPGLLVDRGEFDRLLLQRARDLGVRVLQPARVRHICRDRHEWRVDVAVDADAAVHLRVDFLATATGRSARIAAGKSFTGPRTLALYAYWRGRSLPQEPRIEAGRDAWYWGVPLPDGTFNTLVFVDAKRARGPGSLRERFEQLLRGSSLAADCRDAQMLGGVRAHDATAYFDGGCVTRSSIKIGDTALAIDPISSSGVQKAIQSAVAAAATVNTLLRRPAAGDAAIRFYRDSLADASRRHARWAAEHYHPVAVRLGGEFWEARAAAPTTAPAAAPARLPAVSALDARAITGLRLELSARADFVDLPCIEGDFVTVKSALRHPNLESPVAYLGNWELAPLLRRLKPGATAWQLAQAWSSQLAPRNGLSVAAWLVRQGILVECA